MVEIKTAISFDEYTAIIDKVVNDCFLDGTYSPANYDLSFRTAMISVFAPDYDLSDCKDNNSLWERVTSDEADDIIDKIYENKYFVCYDMENRIKEAIDYRIKMITSSPMSMSDLALSKLFEVLTEKVESIDTSMLTKENMDTVIKAVNATQDGNFAENLVNTMLDKGLLKTFDKEINVTSNSDTETDKSKGSES